MTSTQTAPEPFGSGAVLCLQEREALTRQGLRRCNMCLRILPLEAFHRRGAGHQHRCKECICAYGRANLVTVRKKSWRSHLLMKYGLTVEQWEAMLIAQQGRCAVCAEPMVEPQVDHDHRCCPGVRTCGQCLRGLLCTQCNHGLGRFQDSPALLRAAIRYLEAEAQHVDGTVTP